MFQTKTAQKPAQKAITQTTGVHTPVEAPAKYDKPIIIDEVETEVSAADDPVELLYDQIVAFFDSCTC